MLGASNDKEKLVDSIVSSLCKKKRYTYKLTGSW